MAMTATTLAVPAETSQHGLPPAIHLADRCDRCGAQAWMLFQVGGLPLLFCRHHGRRYEPGLVAAGGRLLLDQGGQLETEQANRNKGPAD